MGELGKEGLQALWLVYSYRELPWESSWKFISSTLCLCAPWKILRHSPGVLIPQCEDHLELLWANTLTFFGGEGGLGSYYVAEADLKLVILLPLPPSTGITYMRHQALLYLLFNYHFLTFRMGINQRTGFIGFLC